MLNRIVGKYIEVTIGAFNNVHIKCDDTRYMLTAFDAQDGMPFVGGLTILGVSLSRVSEDDVPEYDYGLSEQDTAYDIEYFCYMLAITSNQGVHNLYYLTAVVDGDYSHDNKPELTFK